MQGSGRRGQETLGQERVQGQRRLRDRRLQTEDVAAFRGRGFQAGPRSSNRASIRKPMHKFTEYGIGLGLRVPHLNHILERKPVVDWFEIISENYMVDGGRPPTVLDRILEQYKVVQHGVSMYFGSAEPLNRDHLKRLKALVRRTRTPWLTDHLCWGSVDGRYTHDLLPMPYTFLRLPGSPHGRSGRPRTSWKCRSPLRT